MIEIYRSLLALGWSVAPLQPRRKVGYRAVPWSRYKDRRATEYEVAEWCRRFGSHNIALIAGPISGFFVLDVDGELGRRSLAKLGPIPETVTTISGRHGGGNHYLFRLPDFPLRSSYGLHGFDGLDIIHGGYIVAPGSIHQSGTPYRWKLDPWSTPMAPAPTWLLDMLRPDRSAKPRTSSTFTSNSPYVDAAVRRLQGDIRNAAAGTANNTLYLAAVQLGKLIADDRTGIYNALMDAAADRSIPHREAHNTIWSGFKGADRRYRGAA